MVLMIQVGQYHHKGPYSYEGAEGSEKDIYQQKQKLEGYGYWP